MSNVIRNQQRRKIKETLKGMGFKLNKADNTSKKKNVPDRKSWKKKSEAIRKYKVKKLNDRRLSLQAKKQTLEEKTEE